MPDSLNKFVRTNPLKLNIMKKVVLFFALMLSVTSSFISCRDEPEDRGDQIEESTDELEEAGDEIEDEYDEVD